MSLEQLHPGVFSIKTETETLLATLNQRPGQAVYGETLIDLDGRQYRSWSPFRSKLAAAIMKGLRNVRLSSGYRVLYLGVASGTTCSHISDIVGPSGHIWGVEFSPRSMRDLIEKLVKHRENISPILADARHPERYAVLVPRVDAIYADVAQPDQAMILVKNAASFLKEGGWATMAIKSRSIDVSKAPQEVYRQQMGVLERGGLEVVESLELDPYERDHALVVCRL
jgi:fibrillarin-like pre-rRNA processing protein